MSLPKPHFIGAPRDAVAGNSLSVAKTGERVALIVKAKTDTFAGKRKRRRFLLSGRNRRSLILTRPGRHERRNPMRYAWVSAD